MHSMRNSCAVMSCGSPIVVIIEKYEARSLPFTKVMDSTGLSLRPAMPRSFTPGYFLRSSRSSVVFLSRTCPIDSRFTRCSRPDATTSQFSMKGRMPCGSNMRCRRLRGLLRDVRSMKELKKRGAASLVFNTFQYRSITMAGCGSCCVSMRSIATRIAAISGTFQVLSRKFGAYPKASKRAFCSRNGISSAFDKHSSSSRLATLRPLSTKLMWR